MDLTKTKYREPSNQKNRISGSDFPKKGKKKKIILIILAVFILAGLIFAWRAGFIFNKISTKGGLLKSLLHNIPGVEDELKGEKEGRINVILLGMRGENVPGGGLLADTIMVMSVKPQENKASLISIPRDLYVDVPEKGMKSKINSVYAYGEDRKKNGGGIEDMKKVIGDISGVTIHYGVAINFKGFTELIDAIGGIDVTLKEPFLESMQFQEEHVCDPNVFTVPTGNYEYKKNEKGKIVAQYPLCKNPDIECGGIFELPAGTSHLDGAKALCYARARYSTNDFDRAKRQQAVIQAAKERAVSIGTLSDFGKINSILGALGNNVKTDMQLWEMQEMYRVYSSMVNPEIFQKILDSSEEGLLYAPENTGEAGYILLPRGDSYDRIKALFQEIFNVPQAQNKTVKK